MNQEEAEGKRVVHLTVIFTDGKRRTFDIEAATTKVIHLINFINQDGSVNQPPNTTTVILYHGKIVDSDELIGNLDSLDEFAVHCFYRVIKLDIESSKLENLDLRGFDRLQRMNYSPEQIQRIRQNFRETINRSGSEQLDQMTEQDQIEIEDEWFPAIFSSELPLSSILDDIDDMPDVPIQRNRIAAIWNQTCVFFFFGFLLGYLFGVGAFIFATLTFRNKKAIAGIFVGSCAHYIRTVMRN